MRQNQKIGKAARRIGDIGENHRIRRRGNAPRNMHLPILSIAVELDYSVVKKGFNEVALEWFENSKSHAALAEKNIQT